MRGSFPAMAFLFCMQLLMLQEMMSLPSLACPPDGKACTDCIVNSMKSDCPACGKMIQCMAKCLWGGTSQSKCIKKCDCNSGYPRLSDCKKCLSQCQCSCSI